MGVHGRTRVEAGPGVVISHESALKMWVRARLACGRLVREWLDELYPTDMLLAMREEEVSADTSLAPLELPAKIASWARHSLSELPFTDSAGAVDVLVGKHRSRRCSRHVRAHVWHGPVPDGLLVRLSRGVYLCSPELVLLQLAGTMTRVALLELAYMLCGSYAVDPDGGALHEGLMPLTSPERLARVCQLSEGVVGVRSARFAAKFVHAGARSPMEAQLAILLGLPRRLGGYGCGPILMDYHVDLPEAAQRQAGRGYVVADIYLPRAHVDVEYQGYRHRYAASHASDDSKSNALLMVGIQTVSVWGEQLYNESAMEGIAGLLLESSGIDRRPDSGLMLVRRGSLMAELRASSLPDSES